MNTLRLTLCASLVSAALALAVGEDAMTPRDVLRQMTECRRLGRALRRRISDATAAEHLRREASQAAVDEFDRLYDPERVVELRKRLQSASESIAPRQAELTALRVESPDVRDERRVEAEAEVEEARTAGTDAEQKAVAQLKEERTAYLAESRPVAAALKALVAGVARVPDGLGIAEVRTTVDMHTVCIGFTWHDDKGSILVSARCELLRRVPEKTLGFGRIAGNYLVSNIGEGYVCIRAGGVKAALTVRKAEWKGQMRVRELAPKLMDLDALAALPMVEEALRRSATPGAVREGGKAEEIIREVAECMRQRDAFQEGIRDATAQSRLRYRVATRVANEYGRPYGAKRLANQEYVLRLAQELVAKLDAALEVAQMENPALRAVREAEARKELARAKTAHREATARFGREREALHQESLSVSRTLAALTEDMAFTPAGLGIADVQVKAIAENGVIIFTWRDAEKKPLVSASLFPEPVPAGRYDLGRIAGKHQIDSLSASNVSFWAGGVHVSFYCRTEEWQGRDRLPVLAAKLMDLDALAALPVIGRAK